MALSRRAVPYSKPDLNFLNNDVMEDTWDPRTNPRGWINLGIAENSLMHGTMVDYINKNMVVQPICLTYGDNYKRLKAAFARFLNRHLKPVTPIKPAHLRTMNGCTTLLQYLSWALANPGDTILFGRPYYGAFPKDFHRRTSVNIGGVVFGDMDQFGIEAIEKYEDQIFQSHADGRRVAAILICHPHNPLGRSYTREALIGFMKLCDRHKIHLICDEIYALSTYTNDIDTESPLTPFQSILSIDPTGLIDPSLLHVLWGMSKDFGANGLRVGTVISQHNEGLLTSFTNMADFTWSSSLADLATITVLNDDVFTEAYIEENQRKLGETYHRVATWAKQQDIEYTPGSNAGIFIWINIGGAYKKNHKVDEQDLDAVVMKALVEKKVFLADGPQFGAEKPGWFRLVFSRDAAILDEGLRRIELAVQ